jgi:hypothetical protein
MCTILTLNICLMCHTQELNLYRNQIGNAGLTALAKAVESGALPKCTILMLDGNPGDSAPVTKAMKERKK